MRELVGVPLVERLPVSRVEANPYRGWAMVPNEAHYTYLERVEVNELGLRGPGPARERDSERVLLALGDSLVYGQGVGERDTLPSRLEEELQRLAPGERPWRVLNAGHRGYATNQELGLLRELGPRIRPAVALLFWFWNDLEEPRIDAIARRLQHSGPVEFDANEELAGPVLVRWELEQVARRSALLMVLHDIRRAARRAPIEPDELEHQLARLERRLAGFRRDSALLGARPIFVVLPDAAALRGEHESVAIGGRALALAGAAGIEAFDLLPAMRERFGERRRLPILPYDGHYDAEANRVLAEALAAWLAPRVGELQR